jgi:hypothetical protein
VPTRLRWPAAQPRRVNRLLADAEAWRDEPCIAANDRARRMRRWGHPSWRPHAESAHRALPCHDPCQAIMPRVPGRAAADTFQRGHADRSGAPLSVTPQLSLSFGPMRFPLTFSVYRRAESRPSGRRRRVHRLQLETDNLTRGGKARSADAVNACWRMWALSTNEILSTPRPPGETETLRSGRRSAAAAVDNSSVCRSRPFPPTFSVSRRPEGRP